MGSIEVTDSLSIDDRDISYSFVRATGPGGQNVNKVATAVQLRYDVGRAHSLPCEVRRRLREIAGRRMSAEGILVITARRYRSQDKNRQDAVERLVGLVRRAAYRRVVRKATKPTAASRQRRLAAKRRRAERKRTRLPVNPDDQ